MAKGKKAKKSKEKKDQVVPQVTTLPILKGRANVLCPRLGDAIVLTNKVTQILEETAQQVIQRASLKQSTTVNLSGHNLYKLGIESEYIPGLRSIISINLSKNNLFDSAELFNVSYSVKFVRFTIIRFQTLAQLPSLTQLNLSENYLNGFLDSSAGKLVSIRDINLDSNQITALPSSIGGWVGIQRFSIAFNSISELPSECIEWTLLESLNIRGNKVSSIDPFIAKWSQVLHNYHSKFVLRRIEVGKTDRRVKPNQISAGNDRELLSIEGIGCFLVNIAH